ncbi:MAG: hypothetical protein ACLGHN_15985, partial [Bacteriovoracia bacterium]
IMLLLGNLEDEVKQECLRLIMPKGSVYLFDNGIVFALKIKAEKKSISSRRIYMATAQRKTQQKYKNEERQLRLVEDYDQGVVQSQIRKIPSDTFLWLAAGSIVTSMGLKYFGKDENSLFVGQWAPTFAILGVLDKLLHSSSKQ